MLNDHETLQRVLQIAARTETRMVRLSKGLGVDVMLDDRPRMVLLSLNPPLIELTGLDTTISDVLAFCRKEGIVARIVTLMHNGQVVGSVALQQVSHPSPQPERAA